MNLGKLSKRLRKELLANPKQAIVLAIVCLVACWFWSPLLLKRFKAKGKGPIATSDPIPAAENVAAKVAAQRPWFDIHHRRRADPLTRSAALAEDTRDPFRLLKAASAASDETEEGEQTERPIAEPVRPESLNLVLEAIVYGGTRRLARINGSTLMENDEVVIGSEDEESEGAASKSVGRVVAIHPTEVVLEVGNQSLRLSLQPKLLGRGEVVKRMRTQ
jgi:hypothetical protein